MRRLNKRGAFRGALIALAGLIPATAVVGQTPWKNPRDIEIPMLKKIEVPKPERMELKNGMVVYLLENDDFPVVDVRALIRIGSIYEPAEKVGLASITGQVMRTGGSTKTDGDALDELLESMGGSVEINIGGTQGTATVSTLSQDLETGVRILNEILRDPTFPEDKIDLAKKQERTSIASRNDEAFPILGRELSKLIYGADHPYARHTEYATIEAITRDDLIAFHRDYFHPDRMILTVYGDFNKGQVKKLLKNVFEKWPQSKTELPPDPKVSPTEVTGLFVANKDGLTNSVVVLGHEGLRMDHPDYASMQLFHEVMGGGFSSRLFNEIRSRRGLAYATGSGSGSGMHHPGAQLFYAVTQTDSTVATLGYVKQELEKSLAAPLTEEELQRAKDSILNSLVFSLSSKGAVLNRLAAYEFYGYPGDFLDRYQEAIQSATPETVWEAAKKNLRYPDMASLIVGEKEIFEESLTVLGPHTDLDISIPEPAGEEVPDATPEALAQGQELMRAVVDAAGGDAIGKIKDMTVVESGVFSVQGMELQISSTTVTQFPDCQRSEQKLPMGTLVQSVCGDKAWMDMMQGPQEMSADVKAEFEKQKTRDLMTVFRNYQDYQLQALSESATVNGQPADVIFVRSDLVQGWKIYVDRASKRLVQMEYRDRSMAGAPVGATLVMEDFREVDGLVWPHQRQILHDGEPLATLSTTSVEINTGVDTSLFQMP